MRFDAPLCPECGAVAERLLVRVLGFERITRSPDESYVGDDSTDVAWDTQAPEEDTEGHVTLYCQNGHEWPSRVRT